MKQDQTSQQISQAPQTVASQTVVSQTVASQT
jgi:hypothetical protein